MAFSLGASAITTPTGEDPEHRLKAGALLGAFELEHLPLRDVADDLSRKAERQREGLEPMHVAGPAITFAELLDWWWEEYGQRLRSRDLRSFVDKHLRASLGNPNLREVTTSQLEGMLQRESRDLAPKSLSNLRALVHRIFALAIKREKWIGSNPATGVERRRVPKLLPQYLRLEGL